MNSLSFQFANYTPVEFEQLRNAVQKDGFVLTQNTIDKVSGHIGALTYLDANYNRNQQVVTVTVKTSPWQSFQSNELEENIFRITGRPDATKTPVQATPIQSPKTPEGSGANTPGKNIATPAIPPSSGQTSNKKPEEVKPEVELKTGDAAKPPVPTQTPIPAKSAKPEDDPNKNLVTEKEDKGADLSKAAAPTPTK